MKSLGLDLENVLLTSLKGLVYKRVQSDISELNRTELTWFSFWRTDQWASSNALQQAPSNGVGGLPD